MDSTTYLYALIITQMCYTSSSSLTIPSFAMPKKVELPKPLGESAHAFQPTLRFLFFKHQLEFTLRLFFRK